MDFVKIDGVFVRNVLEDEVNLLFIKSIVEIAHAMGKQVIVEFVENKEVLELMRSIGADYAQGFEIDRPRELRPRVADEHESKKVLWG